MQKSTDEFYLDEAEKLLHKELNVVSLLQEIRYPNMVCRYVVPKEKNEELVELSK